MTERAPHAIEPTNDAFPAATLSRVTGLLYLLIIGLGLFSELGVRARMRVPGNASVTAERILDGALLFRVGFSSDVVVFLIDVAVAVLLYVLLRHVHRTGALLAAGFRLTGTAIYGANLLNQLAALLLLTGSGYATGLDEAQAQALSLFFLEVHAHGYDLGLVFFGAHCLALSYLLLRPPVAPRALGALMGLAGVAYLVGSFTRFLAPEFVGAVAWIYVFPLLGELGLSLWLLVKGVQPER